MLYLEELEKRKIDPNFWTSEEYFQKAGLKMMYENGWLFMEEGGVAVVPPLPIEPSAPFSREVWSDFHPTEAPPFFGPLISTFLDFEYIYDPLHFNNMEGARWSVFRKNCRKWPQRNIGKIEYKRVPNLCPGIYELAVNWLTSMDNAGQKEIHDGEVLLAYLYKGFNRKGLWLDGKLMGVNIWDTNYKFINYRYCICQPDQPFLSEYLRWLFYTDRVIQLNRKQTGRLVNDGGVLDRPALKSFKDKMNPFHVRPVHSWKRV